MRLAVNDLSFWVQGEAVIAQRQEVLWEWRAGVRPHQEGLGQLRLVGQQPLQPELTDGRAPGGLHPQGQRRARPGSLPARGPALQRHEVWQHFTMRVSRNTVMGQQHLLTLHHSGDKSCDTQTALKALATQ